ncbi:Uncharacterised protein [Klebsiella pneumoniae]|nr:hypothetical protein DD568_18725 [Klebsiella pneumoniae]SYE75557.1 Uncharacterised protein [Klebsiella pneumoniae]HBX3914704.1 hypothetical protein [Klebsiella pneumoniae subsp. pneumoniae]
MRNSIKLNMEKSAEKVAEFDSWLPNIIGWELNISGFKNRVIKDEKELKRLIKIYIKHPFNSRQTGILLTNGVTNRFAEDIESNLDKYFLYKAYLNLNTNPLKEELIDGIVTKVEEMVDIYKSELNAFSFK